VLSASLKKRTCFHRPAEIAKLLFPKEGEANMDTNTRQTTQPWNKGKLTGAKPALLPKHVWNRLRDLALFDLAIDSKLRGCDVVRLKVVDVARMDMRSIEHPFVSAKQAGPFASKSLSKLAKRSTTIFPNGPPLMHTSSPDVAQLAI
jgi:hypothetical protein